MNEIDEPAAVYILIMVFGLLGAGAACYKLLHKAKVRIDCAREYVNLLDRDKCMEERK